MCARSIAACAKLNGVTDGLSRLGETAVFLAATLLRLGEEQFSRNVVVERHGESMPLGRLLDSGNGGQSRFRSVSVHSIATFTFREPRFWLKGSRRDRVVRHGHGPHRAIQTGVGPVEVRRAKVRDRGDVGAEEKIRFTSSILPKWARRTKSLDALLPVLYLHGASTGDFQEALGTLLDKDAPNLSPAVISRLTAEWQADYDAWQKRDPSARRYVYVWADGVYLQARMEEAAECMLVLIGAAPEGKKELVGFQTGVRESA
jgi:hypothetical protein